ncbi:hypothetical protein D9611_004321 [Ephemerocybe angulata]|uniref:NYN domain-containing protein n=1 Tax=Ephemerocybe angulata TaxID=980116 RepID=A0A8H5F664_9AGAR|nr:hypothetical protein D9611_004321 [Tulosesus angulatus]
MPADRNEVAIFWDYGSCPAPDGLTGYTLVHNIRSLALRFGNISIFKAYLSVGDHYSLGKDATGNALLRSELQSSGVSLTDVPAPKDVADKMLIVDLLAYAFDRPIDTTVLILISADPSLSYALSVLRLRSHTTVIITPPDTKPDLWMQATLCFDWNTEITCRSEGLPFDSRSVPRLEPTRTSDIPTKSPYTHPLDYGASVDPCKVGASSVPDNGDDVLLEDFVNPLASRLEDFVISNDELDSNRVGLRQTDNGPGITSSSSASPPQSLPSAARSMSGENNTSSLQAPTSGQRSHEYSPNPPSLSAPTSGAPEQGHTGGSVNRQLFNRLRKKVPPGFRPLVDILHSLREEGHRRPLRSNVGLQLLKKDPQVYKKAGHVRFAQYAATAVTLGIVELGGKDGKAWICLHPTLEQ